MNNEQQIVELAKKLRGHAWLARFRKADDKKNNYAHLSDQACNDIAGYVDDLLDLIDPPQPVPQVEEYEVCFASNNGLHTTLFRMKGSDDVCSFGGVGKLSEWERGGWKTGPWHSRTVTH